MSGPRKPVRRRVALRVHGQRDRQETTDPLLVPVPAGYGACVRPASSGPAPAVLAPAVRAAAANLAKAPGYGSTRWHLSTIRARKLIIASSSIA